MITVPQKTLGWLWNVLGRDYIDPNRTYSDLAQTLSQYPALAPRTDVYTYENGASALLLHFKGTIPVNFRGATYRIPIALWIPHRYPQEGPLVYVVPTDGMVIRPGQHVSGEGRVYHPYLARWGQSPETSSVIEILSILSDVFAREPPVIAKQTTRAPTQSPVSGPPPVPPLPHELQRPGSATPSVQPAQGPPPPPPKPSGTSATAQSTEQRQLGRYESAPPLPPQTTSPDPRQGHPYGNGQPVSPLPGSQFQPQRTSSLRHSVTAAQIQGVPDGSYTAQQSYSVAPGQGPYDPRQSLASPLPQGVMPLRSPTLPQNGPYHPRAAPGRTSPGQYGHPSYAHQTPLQQPKPKQPQVDLLDSPFDVPLPVTQATNIPPPPIPRNPEKEALLQTLSQTLTQHLQSSITQNALALPSLQAQHTALGTSLSTLESEFGAVTNLNHTLQSNISILQTAIHQSDAAISDAQSRAAKGDIPSIDDMLVPPTVVGKQLYDVVTDARGIDAAIWALQIALVRGRISTDVWARRTRELSRELFAKKALEKKIGRGLGLEE